MGQRHVHQTRLQGVEQLRRMRLCSQKLELLLLLLLPPPQGQHGAARHNIRPQGRARLACALTRLMRRGVLVVRLLAPPTPLDTVSSCVCVCVCVCAVCVSVCVCVCVDCVCECE